MGDDTANVTQLAQTPEETAKRHPIYWFEDGTLTLRVEDRLFRVHRSFVCRQSRLLGHLSASSQDQWIRLVTLTDQNDQDNKNWLHIGAKESVAVKDLEVLFEHLYHDEPLTQTSGFNRVTSILRVSGPNQLDIPRIHERARTLFELILPAEPLLLNPETHPVYEGLQVATEHNFHEIRKAILYTLVTTHQFEDDEEGSAQSPDYEQGPQAQTSPERAPNSPEASPSNSLNHVSNPGNSDLIVGEANNSSNNPRFSQQDEALCRRLLTQIIQHFTPLLYTPATASHMDCTDVFADMWMPYVIQPSLEDDGVYKPLETLERIKNIDWAKEGLCPSCVADKHKEWTEEQKVVWELLDGWVQE